MSVYQSDIKRIMKQLLLTYETKIVHDKDRKIERIGAVELMILEHVSEHENTTQNDLLEIFPYKRAKLLGIIKKMLEYDYLVKKENPSDKRSHYLSLGLNGLALLENYGKHEEIFLDFVLRDMTINEEKAIVKFLSKIQQTGYMK